MEREVRRAGADPIYFRKAMVRTAGVVGMRQGSEQSDWGH